MMVKRSKISIVENAAGGGLNISSLYHDHWASLCKFLNRQFGSGPPDPEDLAQAAFEKIMSLKDTSSIRNPRAFLYTVARNFALEHKRRGRTQDRYIEDVMQEYDENLEQITPERILIEKQRLHVMEKTIAGMPYKQRKVLKLSRFNGMSYREIADETGWSVSDVARQVNNAMALLDEALERVSAGQ